MIPVRNIIAPEAMAILRERSKRFQEMLSIEIRKALLKPSKSWKRDDTP
jgi:hypothetical protein